MIYNEIEYYDIPCSLDRKKSKEFFSVEFFGKKMKEYFG